MVGVEPNAQGKGLGGALMRHAVARCDQEGALATLGSSNPRNISPYERHGFEVMGEICGAARHADAEAVALAGRQQRVPLAVW